MALYSYGLYSYGPIRLWGYIVIALYSYCLYSYGMYNYGAAGEKTELAAGDFPLAWEVLYIDHDTIYRT